MTYDPNNPVDYAESVEVWCTFPGCDVILRCDWSEQPDTVARVARHAIEAHGATPDDPPPPSDDPPPCDAGPQPAMRPWRAKLLRERTPTSDGRVVQRKATTWGTMPLPVICDGSAVGRVDRVWRRGRNIMAEGIVDASVPGIPFPMPRTWACKPPADFDTGLLTFTALHFDQVMWDDTQPAWPFVGETRRRWWQRRTP